MSLQAKPAPNESPALVVFGRDQAGKHHASRFVEAEAKLAAKAAGLMGFQVLRIRGEEHRALAAELPKGRVFASGKAFVPFVKASLFAKLQEAAQSSGAKPLALVTNTLVHAGSDKPPVAGKGDEPKAPDKPKPPCGWADIQVGSVVLATEGPKEGWFESVVIGVEREDLFALRWRDYPDEPNFVRRRAHVALLHPAGRTPV